MSKKTAELGIGKGRHAIQREAQQGYADLFDHLEWVAL